MRGDQWLAHGWSLHLGRILTAPRWSCGGSDREFEPPDPAFESPDGGSHELYPIQGDDDDRITRDSTYIRGQRYPGNSGWKIHHPDGTIRDLRHHTAAENQDDSGWYTTLIVDQSGNRIKIEYHDAPNDAAIKKIVDSHGRVVWFDLYPDDPGVNPLIVGRLWKIRHEAFGGTPTETVFTYETAVLATAPSFVPGAPPNPGFPLTVTRVHEIELPLRATYSFEYNDYGELSSVVVPTGGRIDYEWEEGFYVYQALMCKPGAPPEECPPPPVNRSNGRGVRSRAVYVDGDRLNTDPENMAVSSWHRPCGWIWLSSEPGPAPPPEWMDYFPWRVITTDPYGNQTMHFFDVLGRIAGESNFGGGAGYGKLLETRSFHGPLAVSDAIWTADWDVLGDEISRTRYKWEFDRFGTYGRGNARMIEESTSFFEDGTWQTRSNCASDGYGHFKASVLRATNTGDHRLQVHPLSTVMQPEPIPCRWVLHPDAGSAVIENGLAAVTERRWSLLGQQTAELRHGEYEPYAFSEASCDTRPLLSFVMSDAGEAMEQSLDDTGNGLDFGDVTASPYPVPVGACDLPVALQLPLQLPPVNPPLGDLAG